MRKTLALTLGLLLALAGVDSAQLATGNIYASVKDESGAVLPQAGEMPQALPANAAGHSRIG